MDDLNLAIPENVFDFFAADPFGPMLTLSRAADDADSLIHSQLNLFLETIPSEAVSMACKDSQFLWFCNKAASVDREARIWIAERLILREVSRRRIQLLREGCEGRRPRPYGIPALADLNIDEEHLVPLSEFQFDGSRLLRNGHAFTVLSTTSSPNSTYWLLDMIYKERLSKPMSVRLDPLLFGPSDTFPSVSYRMLVYGQPLNWERISGLQQTEHGRWFPSSLSHQSEFTDFCWEPRGHEIHCLCEEVPLGRSVILQGSRYLHAIYVPTSGTVEHFDGALRLFTEEEVQVRHGLHVRKSGKLGIREKVFRTDEPIPKDSFGVITQAFFVWNYDVQSYFSKTLADPSALPK